MNSTYGSIDDINFPDVFIEALASSDSETTDKTVRDHHSLYQPLVDIEDTIDAITDTLQWEKAGKNTLVAIIAICLAFGVIVLFVIVSGIIYHRFNIFFKLVICFHSLCFLKIDVAILDIVKLITMM